MPENTLNPPEHWADLSEEERVAVHELAKSRIFWKQLGTRLQWLKGVATIGLTLAAAWSLLGESLSQWLNLKQ